MEQAMEAMVHDLLFPGSTATMLGYQASLSETFFGFFLNPTDRPTQYQDTHSTLKEKTRGMA